MCVIERFVWLQYNLGQSWRQQLELTKSLYIMVVHCKNESVYSTPLCPNTHTVYGLVCVLGQFSVQYTHSFLQCGIFGPLTVDQICISSNHTV